MRSKSVLIVVCAVLLLAAAAVYIRPPCAAGRYYPADPKQLLAAVEQYIGEADPPALPGRYLACITPHSAYPYCGAVAAHAFKSLQPGQYDRVIVLGSSHFASFRGCSVPTVRFFVTPLGFTEVDVEAVSRLEWCPLIDLRSVGSKTMKVFKDGSSRSPLHEIEHSVETVLPFLQATLRRFKLVPIVVGDFKDYHGKIDRNALDSVAEALAKIVDDRTFIVASTDLTHFGNLYGYRPFDKADPELLEELDMQALDIVFHRDPAAFDTYLDMTQNSICGANVLEILMRLLPNGTRGVLLEYDTSTRKTGNPDLSVSYASAAFYNPDLPPAQGHPLPPLVLPETQPAATKAAIPTGAVPEGAVKVGDSDAKAAKPDEDERPGPRAEGRKTRTASKKGAKGSGKGEP